MPTYETSPHVAWRRIESAGRAEIVIAQLIALRPLSRRAAAVGGIGAIVMFLTLSFAVSTPGSWAIVDGIPVPAGAGAFVIKDLFLLGAALWDSGRGARVIR
jgi:uncharacterized membrane protein YkgB